MICRVLGHELYDNISFVRKHNPQQRWSSPFKNEAAKVALTQTKNDENSGL